MLNTSDGHKPPWRIILVLLALALFLSWLQFNQWPMPVTSGIDHRDSGVFAFGGWVIASGGIPYLDFWDQKPPLVFLLNAVAVRLADMQLVGAWWLSLLAILSTLPLAWAVMRRWTSQGVALAGMALYAVSFTGVLQTGNSVELYTLPFRWMLWANVLQWVEHRETTRNRSLKVLLALYMGILAGVLFSLRQNEILTAVALIGVLGWQLIREKKYNDLGLLLGVSAVGFLLVWTPILVYLASNHALGAFWDQVFRYNFQHKIVTTPLHRLDAFGAAFDFLPLYAIAVLSWWLLILRKRSSTNSLGFRERLLLGVTPLETFMVLVSGQRFPHYFISLLPLSALAAAWVLERYAAGWGRSPQRARRIVVGIALLMGVVTLVKTPHNLIQPVYSMRGHIEHQAADRIKEMSSPGDVLFVWGMAPEVYVYSGLKPFGSYTHVYPLLSPGYTDTTVVRTFLKQMAANPPALILDASSHNGRIPSLDKWNSHFPLFDTTLQPELEKFYDYCRANYVEEEKLTGWGWTIYRRKPSTDTSNP